MRNSTTIFAISLSALISTSMSKNSSLKNLFKDLNITKYWYYTLQCFAADSREKNYPHITQYNGKFMNGIETTKISVSVYHQSR